MAAPTVALPSRMADRAPGPSDRSARRPERRRLLHGPGRAVLHDAARRPRGGRHQGGAAGGRRDARLGPAVGRRPTADGTRTAAYYLAVNRNKRSIRLDLKRPKAPRSCAGCSPAATSWSRTSGSAGSRASGFDDDALERLNPALVHLAITGYGPDGPAADRPGYDFVIQAVERPDVDHRRGRRGRRRPDQGRRRDQRRRDRDARGGRRAGGAASGANAPPVRDRGLGPADRRLAPRRTLAVLVNQAQNAFVTGAAPVRLGNAHPNIVPYETFETADGEIAVGGRVGAPVAAAVRRARAAGPGRRSAVRDERRSRRATGGVAADPRRAVRGALAADWLAVLEAAEIPGGPINDILAAFASPEAVARGMTVELEHPAWGVIRQVGIPFELSATPASIRIAAAAARRAHGRDPRGARLRRGRDRRAAGGRGRLTPLTGG